MSINVYVITVYNPCCDDLLKSSCNFNAENVSFVTMLILIGSADFHEIYSKKFESTFFAVVYDVSNDYESVQVT